MTRPSPPALADDRIELRIPDDVVIPPAGPPIYLELLGAKSIDTVAIPPHSDMQKLGITKVRRYRWTL